MKTTIIICLLFFAGFLCCYAPAMAELTILGNGIAEDYGIPHITSKTLEIASQRLTEGAIYGVASYYDYILDSGWSSVDHYVCATRDFPRYSYVKVTDLDTGKSVVCKVTDFGPDKSIHSDRVVDLSSTAFAELRPLKYGLIKNVMVTKL